MFGWGLYRGLSIYDVLEFEQSSSRHTESL